MEAKRSTPLVVMSIFHFIGGGWGLLIACCNGVGVGVIVSLGSSTARGNDPFMEAMSVYSAAVLRNVPGFVAITVAQALLDLILSVMLLAAGVGLLKARKWAWTTSLAYAALGIVVALILGGLQFTVVNPGMEKAEKEADEYLQKQMNVPPEDPNNPFNSPLFAAATSVGAVIFRMAYPVIVIMVMLLPSVRAAVNASAPPERYRDDAEDYFERRPGEM